MTFDAKQFLADEWRVVLASKTFKLVMAAEAVAVPTFVWGLVDGTIPPTKQSALGFLVMQVVLVGKILHRNTMAGVEAKVDALAGQGTAASIEASAEKRLLDLARAKGHGAVADALAVEIAKPDPTPAAGA